MSTNLLDAIRKTAKNLDSPGAWRGEANQRLLEAATEIDRLRREANATRSAHQSEVSGLLDKIDKLKADLEAARATGGQP